MAGRQARLTGALTTGALALLGARLVLGRIRTMSFRGAVVLVTGGSRGLGLLLAREFGRRGAHVAICARDPDELERARLDLETRGVACLPLRCDVADVTRVDAMVGEIHERGVRSTCS
jgi:NAD(P)-dependent dehydrogenase (short-subunit alcohol dehydrogenase family)